MTIIIKGVSETVKNESKKKKVEFLSMLWGTLGASLLGNLFAGKIKLIADESTIKAEQDF